MVDVQAAPRDHGRMDTDAAPRPILLTDYRPPAFLVDTVDLVFDLDPVQTRVRARLGLTRNPAGPGGPLHLDGEGLTLLSLACDGFARAVTPDGTGLTLDDLPDTCSLDIETQIAPASNTDFTGLYLSGGNYFTQCEAEGFRRITFFPDRPDVMSRYTVTIVAEPTACPVMLSNGNEVDRGTTADGRHWSKWEDPHPKPSYLFALVAGDLLAVRDRFTTASGRDVALGIYVRRGDEDKCAHAMHALKQSMRWDEAVFGLEYDLDVFNIAAVSDFNMGAMENKGLNVFNTKYVLAKPATATDGDYQGIETVIAHEYFHNWTGNRVTCRDWFQLSLKEGLTVFRDQEFTADQGSRAVKRIADVRRLRASQFPEDAGPLAHPVRPDHYVKIDNFYTATVYQKGAEVVRMIHTLIGVAAFRRGMDLYFQRHDNQAVRIEDFVQAMADASGVDLTQFRRWYDQPGTPEVAISDSYDAVSRRYTLTLRQSLRDQRAGGEKLPLHIPVAIGLLAPDGAALPVRLEGAAAASGDTHVLSLTEAEQVFHFADVPAAPIPSVLRGFSAPVRLSGLGPERLRFLAAHDSDAFVRWESGQQYASVVLLERIARAPRDLPPLDASLIEAMAATLAGADADPAFAAEALALPGENYLADQMAVVDVDAIHAVREDARRSIGRMLAQPLRATYERLADDGPYRIDGAGIGRRALRNTCLSYLIAAGEGMEMAHAQFTAGQNMTDVLAALALLADSDNPHGTAALAAFYQRWKGDELVLDKWFAIQAMARRPDTLARVAALTEHADFDSRNPNRWRALLASFSHANPVRFHDPSGAGYRFLADQLIKLDAINSQVAARQVPPLGTWRRHDAARQALMRAELSRIRVTPGLSSATGEMVGRSLG